MDLFIPLIEHLIYAFNLNHVQPCTARGRIICWPLPQLVVDAMGLLSLSQQIFLRLDV
ncbi:Uncharacterised protein [Vibrio cholerae]|nr:Uncharacterised protein [Vibrio cholerae]